MDRTTARGYVSYKVEDPDQNRFTAAQYNNSLDLASQQFAIDTRSIIKTANIVLVNGQAEYSVPSDFLVCIMVRVLGLKLQPVSKYELSFQSGIDWTTLPSATPTAYYMDEPNDKIGLVPSPDGGSAGTNLILDYVGIPAAITSDSQSLLNADTILQYYTPAIINWAARELLTYIPQTDEVIKKRMEFFKEYERYKNQAITTYNNMIDEPLRMSGGQQWQDAGTINNQDNAFSS